MVLLGGTDRKMRLDSRLQKSKHGIYYLRIQSHGLDRRWSLRTRDPNIAAIAAHEFSAKILRMKNTPHLSGWSMSIDGDKIEITTEDNDQDRASARAAALEIVQAQAAAALALAQAGGAATRPTAVEAEYKKTISLGAAIAEYQPYLDKSDIAEKSKRMAESVLSGLKALLGADFDMSALNDDVIEDRWLDARLKAVAATTAKRDLSFIRGFVEWAADRKRKYAPAKLTITLDAKGENYDYFNRSDIKLIFDNLPRLAENSWQFWLPLLGLYTGGRVAEIASIRTEYVFERSELNVLRLAGTKTAASDREIPIHYDLIRLGFLDYVEHRRKLKKEMLFDISRSAQNGDGAQASKFFTEYKSKIGMKERLKVFHSFRPTIVDHLKQADVGFEARCQYVGHDSGGGVHGKVYARNAISLIGMQSAVVDKIDWRKYCGWSPDFGALKAKADTFIKR